MPKFEVSLTYTSTYQVTVDAENEDAAVIDAVVELEYNIPDSVLNYDVDLVEPVEDDDDYED